MTNTTIGKLLSGSEKKDAIHIAIAPVVAGEKLHPGQGVDFVSGNKERVKASDKPIGIVDPFLKMPVFPDQRFWLMLNPNTITSLRHDWEHPSFGSSTSEEWLRDWAKQCGVTYGRLLDIARDYVESGHCTFVGDDSSYQGVDWGMWPEFWKHIEKVTGVKVGDDKSVPFSCAC